MAPPAAPALPALLLATGLLLQARPEGTPPEPPPAARVVAAVAKAAKGNAALPAEKRLSGDALGDALVRAAAAAAGGDGKAFLLGLAHGLDPDGTLARNPLTRAAFRDLETPEEAEARAGALGKPALRGRNDLLLHFACSAAVARLAGEAAAEAAGVAKEAADARPGGSGFSFADLLADVAGVRFAAWVARDPAARLPEVAKSFRGAAFCPDPSREAEGLSEEAFAGLYGSVADDRFRRKLASLRDAVAALPVHAPPAAEAK